MGSTSAGSSRGSFGSRCFIGKKGGKKCGQRNYSLSALNTPSFCLFSGLKNSYLGQFYIFTSINS